nr:pseudouridine synthase [uncultured Arsenicibacter sp.]
MKRDNDFEGNDRREGGRGKFGRRDDDRFGNNRRGEGRQTGGPRRDSGSTDRPRGAGDGERRFGQNRPFDNNNDKPRFNRDNDRPRFNRSDDERGERPRSGGFDRKPFNRDGGDFKPRFNREEGDRKPFNREEGDRKPRFNREEGDRKPFNRDGGDFKPRFNREEGDRKPRFNREEGDRKPFNRDGGDFKPRFNRDGDDRKPRFNREEGDRKPFNRDGGDFKPRFNRDGDDRKPFNREEGDRKPRFNREEGDRKPFNRDGGDFKPRFNRDGDDRKPRFDRDGDDRKPRFDRDGDDRKPRFGKDRDEKKGRRLGRQEEAENGRFSREQTMDSRERRVGKFEKAPTYNLDALREKMPAGKKKAAAREEGGKKTVDDGTVRLNRYIANAGICSRREADELIASGDISVNGKVVTEMGYKVKPNDKVKFGTKNLNPEKTVYILLNKPKDYITTTDDPEERRTVMELVADAGPFRLYPVGRLDRNTTGLLLLTNDGELAEKLTHPSNNVRKIYQAELDKPLTEEHFEAIRNGIELEDGLIKPDDLGIVTPDAQVIGIEIHSGRNRIVRRIFEHFGYEVTKLDRTTYASLTKKELPRGKWRFLEPKEVVKLKFF